MTTIDKEVWTEKELVINQYLHGSQALLKPRPGSQGLQGPKAILMILFVA
jgi:hypothetical protein